MTQWVNVAGQRRIKRRGGLLIGGAKQRRPPTNQDQHATAYRMHMSDGREIRESWSEYLRRMTDRPGWSVAKLARESKIHRATIFKWMSGKGGANMASVQAIAEALGDDSGNALRAASSSGAIEDEFDEDLRIIIRRLRSPDASEAEKTAILGTLKYLADLADRAERGEEDRAAS